jgi:hypothetical protein
MGQIEILETCEYGQKIKIGDVFENKKVSKILLFNWLTNKEYFPLGINLSYFFYEDVTCEWTISLIFD